MKTNCLLSPDNYHDLWKYYPGPTEFRIYVNEDNWETQNNPYSEHAIEPQICRPDQWTFTWPIFEQNNNGEVTAMWNWDNINECIPNQEIFLTLPENSICNITCTYPIEQIINFVKTLPVLKENDDGQLINWFSPYFHYNQATAYYYEQFFRQAFCIYNEFTDYVPYYVLPRNSIGETEGYTGPLISELPMKVDCYGQLCIEIPIIRDLFVERTVEPQQIPFELPIIIAEPYNDGFWELNWPIASMLVILQAR